jgi:epoxyqueuosine reductase
MLMRKLGKSGIDVFTYLEEKRYPGLIIHTEDEFYPFHRMGLLSVKGLAKGASLGWQGRSLLIIFPEYGPVHHWMAVLTDMDIQADEPIPNRCGQCSLCIDKCPKGALTLAHFDGQPECRADVLDIQAYLGDEGCKVCLAVCSWTKSINIH